jgi:hypothetical protein
VERENDTDYQCYHIYFVLVSPWVHTKSETSYHRGTHVQDSLRRQWVTTR